MNVYMWTVHVQSVQFYGCEWSVQQEQCDRLRQRDDDVVADGTIGRRWTATFIPFHEELDMDGLGEVSAAFAAGVGLAQLEIHHTGRVSGQKRRKQNEEVGMDGGGGRGRGGTAAACGNSRCSRSRRGI